MADSNDTIAEPQVVYTVKEMLTKMDAKLDVAIAQMLLKADREELTHVKNDIEDLKAFKAKALGGIAVVGALAAAGAFHIF